MNYILSSCVMARQLILFAKRGIEGDFRNKYIHLVYKISPCPSLIERGILGSMRSFPGTESALILMQSISQGLSTQELSADRRAGALPFL